MYCLETKECWGRLFGAASFFWRGRELKIGKIAVLVWILLLVCLAASFQVGMVRSGLIFLDTFESGSLDSWSDMNFVGASVVSSIKYNGTYSLKHTIDAGPDWTSSWVNKQISPQTTAYVRAFVYFENLPIGENRFYLQKFSTPNVVEQATAFIDEFKRWSIRCRANGMTLDISNETIPSVVTGKWYCVTLKLTLGSGTSGEVRLYVDDVEVVSKTGIDNITGENVTTITCAWSLLACMAPTQTYTVYKDDFAVSTDYIGLHGNATPSIHSSDVNNDGIVNIQDITIVAIAYMSTPEDDNWNPIADIDNNGKINIVDISIVAKDFGKTV